MYSDKTRKIAGGLALALVLAAAAVGLAQRGPDGPHRPGGPGGFGFGRLFSSLGLSTAQQTQIDAIATNYRERTTALRDQLSASQRPADTILSGTPFDEATVRQVAQARAAIQVELEVLNAQMLSEIYGVLTAEQKALLAQRLAQRQEATSLFGRP